MNAVGDRATATLGEVVARCARLLGSATEARWLVEHVTGLHGAALAARLHRAPPEGLDAALDPLLARRRAGEPLQYVLGVWPFRTIELAVDERVLIPRPETEVVAGIALDLLRASGVGGPRRAADLGTGSGAIALALVAEGPVGLQVWATDRSADALAVARANGARLAARDPSTAGRVHFVQGAWFSALPAALAGSLSLVVSNPPYVAEAEWAGLDAAVRDHEPRAALVAGPSGLESIDAVVAGAGRWLAPGGHLVVEIAPHQAGEVAHRASSAGYTGVRVARDLAGRPRALVARQPPTR